MDEIEQDEQGGPELRFNIRDLSLETMKCSKCGCRRQMPLARSSVVIQPLGLMLYECHCGCHQGVYGLLNSGLNYLTGPNPKLPIDELSRLLGDDFQSEDDDEEGKGS